MATIMQRASINRNQCWHKNKMYSKNELDFKFCASREMGYLEKRKRLIRERYKKMEVEKLLNK